MGFITGAIVGGVIAASSSSPSSQDTLIHSDKYDVISCRTTFVYGDDEVRCIGRMKNLTPEEFAAAQGYRFIRKRGIIFINSSEVIVMEVSK